MLKVATILAMAFSWQGLALADVESGPKAGEKVAELKVHAVKGKIEDKEVDYAKEQKDEPTIYLFVNADKFDRPMNRYIKVLDDKLNDISPKLSSIAIWVGGDFDKNKEFLPRIQQSVKYQYTALTVFEGDANGPAGWGVNSAAHLTVVFVNEGKVVKSFAYEAVNDTDLKSLEKLLKETLKK